MISFTPIEIMAAIAVLALICLAAVVIAFSLGRDSVNIDLEVKRRVIQPNLQFVGYQPRATTPPPMMPSPRIKRAEV